MRFYYRLKGEALKRSKAFQKQLEKARGKRDTKTLPDFVEEFGLPTDAVFLYKIGNGEDRVYGFKSESPSLLGFRRDKHGYFVPNGKTKIGKQAAAALKTMLIETETNSLFEYLEVPTGCFANGYFFLTTTQKIGRWHILSCGRQIEHPDCQEVPFGSIAHEYARTKGEKVHD